MLAILTGICYNGVVWSYRKFSVSMISENFMMFEEVTVQNATLFFRSIFRLPQKQVDKSTPPVTETSVTRRFSAFSPCSL